MTWVYPQPLAVLCAECHSQGKVLVLATGVFDMFHQEHQQFLTKAKQAGDVLVVGVEADARVKRMKGHDRPHNSQQERLAQVQSFPVVDFAFLLPDRFDTTQDYRSFLNMVRPHILAVSSHSPHLENKQSLMREIGGEVCIVHEHNPAISTTQLLEQQTQEQSAASVQ